MIFASSSIVKTFIEENPHAYEYTNEEQKFFIENNKSDTEKSKINTTKSISRKIMQTEPNKLTEFLKIVKYHKIHQIS